MRASPLRSSLLLGLVTASLLAVAAPSEAAIIATKKSSTPFPGVVLVEGTTRAPSSRFYAAQVTLCTAGVSVSATAAPTALRTVPSWAAAAGAELAVNGDFFKADPRVYGMAVGSGKAWPITKTGIDPAVAGEFYYDRFGWIAFGPGFVDFTHTEHVKQNPAKFAAKEGWSPTKVTHDFPKGTVALVSGFPELVTEGKRYTCTSATATTCFPDRTDMRDRHPRSAMGLTQDRRTFILAVVDGRTATSAGMYGTELAELMSELGAWQAFNLDGGGSSEMWMKGRGTVNRPSDGASRAVGNHWGILTGGAAAAHCMKVPAKPDAGADGGDAGDGGDDAGNDEDPSTGPSMPGASEGPEGEPGDGAGAAPDDDGAGGCTTAPGGGEGTLIGAAAAFLALAILRRRARARC